MRVLAAFIFIALTMPALAQEEAPLPGDRPVAVEAAPEDAVAIGEAVPLPRRRPPPQPTEAKSPDGSAAAAEGVFAPEVADPKSARIYQGACPAVLLGQVEARALPPIADGQCGERSPLAVTGLLVNGRMVPLAGESIVGCEMASALPEWAAAIDNYLMAREKTRIARILTGTSYACRNRNNSAAGDLSEHGFANALDVVGFELEDGRTMSLPAGWAEALSPEGRLLRFAHDAGCSRFTTTLGPDANALHADHLHLDLGCHGQRCTARLCE